MSCSRVLIVLALVGGNLWFLPLASADSHSSHVVQIAADPQAYSGYSFQPRTVFVRIGDTVTFKNVSDATHTVTDLRAKINAGDIKPRGAWTLTVSALAIKYFCTHHQGMLAGILPASYLHSTTTATSTADKPAPTPQAGSSGGDGPYGLPSTGGAVDH